MNKSHSGHWQAVSMNRHRPVLGRARLIARWSKFAVMSLRKGHTDFARNAIAAQVELLLLSIRDIFLRRKKVECNICGWKGSDFYPNVGPGYYEKRTICPGCDCLDRYRSLAVVLWQYTDFFSPDTTVIEVAPPRNFQKYCLRQKSDRNYISFDIERFAMERGDITQMHYQDNMADYLLCFHVLEHIKDEGLALSEIHRVLKPGGSAILQVPIDWQVEKTREYPAPNPRDVGHVRRYGRDFPQLVSASGFKVTEVSATECVHPEEVERFGLSREPIFLAKRI